MATLNYSSFAYNNATNALCLYIGDLFTDKSANIIISNTNLISNKHLLIEEKGLFTLWGGGTIEHCCILYNEAKILFQCQTTQYITLISCTFPDDILSYFVAIIVIGMS